MVAIDELVLEGGGDVENDDGRQQVRRDLVQRPQHVVAERLVAWNEVGSGNQPNHTTGTPTADVYAQPSSGTTKKSA